MPPFIVSAPRRRRIRFSLTTKRQPIVAATSHQTERPHGLHAQGHRRSAVSPGPASSQRQNRKISTGESRGPKMSSREPVKIPSLFTELPPISDSLSTDTSQIQRETANSCLPFLRGDDDGGPIGPLTSWGVPRLQKDEHLEYLYDSLEDYPVHFVGIDSSRPWMVYWALAGLSLLGKDVTTYRQRVISTFTPMQNPTGGFGGGHGQLSHCASSFAAILCLAMVGGVDAFELINRKAMWRWLGELKLPNGGFQVCTGGEEDVRGAYCAMTIISLLDLPIDLPPEAKTRCHGLQNFSSGLPEYLSRCQTYEGGISGSPGTEAHGAYAFCALACLCILGKPEDTILKYMDVPLLLSWLSARQYSPEGGLSGRTNKLVDGCYSHWVGGCWPLLQSALNGVQAASASVSPSVASLYSREGLARYILGCCQGPNGGLRDKPGKPPDSYHTCYTLCGLSVLQNYHYHTHPGPSFGGIFSSAFSWHYSPILTPSDFEPDVNVFDEDDRVTAFHPVYTIPHWAAENMRAWCEREKVAI